ncbi:MAG: DUF177 domain-containing protein [bacterium]|nr:DUF177 domain-containing protein [bacterium]
MKLDLDRQEHGRSELAIEGDLELGLDDGRPGTAALAGRLMVDNVSGRILLNGELAASGAGVCGRCLKEFNVRWVVPVEVIVLLDEISEEGEGDSLVLHQRTGEVDLRGPLSESAVLAFPQAAVCTENCRGLCPQCGVDRNLEDCTCVADDTDPRWDGLP